MSYESSENLDAWISEAQKTMQRLGECLTEIQSIRSAQKSKAKREAEKEADLEQFAQVCHNSMRLK